MKMKHKKIFILSILIYGCLFFWFINYDRAIKNDNYFLVKFLSNSFYYVNRPNNRGYTPLITAIELGRTDLINLLLDNGADINYSDKYGYTPLGGASKTGSIELVKLLVDRGASVNGVENAWTSPVYYASIDKNNSIVKYLLSKGSKDKTEVFNRTALYNYIIYSNSEEDELILKMLVDSFDNESFDKKYWYYNKAATRMIMEKSYYDLHLFNFVLDKHKSVKNSVTTYGEPLLHFAQDYDRRDLHQEPSLYIKTLVERGADLNRKDPDGGTVLYNALSTSDMRNALYLIDNGASLEMSITSSILTNVIKSKNNDILERLLKRNSDIDINAVQFSEDQESLVELLTKVNSPALVRTFFKYGYRFPREDILEFLSWNKRVFKWDTDFINLLTNQNFDLSSPFLINGRNVETTPLIEAVINESLGGVKLLMSLNVDTEFKYNSKTALTIAKEMNNRNIVRELLKAGNHEQNVKPEIEAAEDLILAIENNAIDAKGKIVFNKYHLDYIGRNKHTPLTAAVAYDRKELVLKLLEHGADINALNGNNMSPLMVAVKNDLENMAYVLLNNQADLYIVRDFKDKKTVMHMLIEEESKYILSTIFMKSPETKTIIFDDKTLLMLAAEAGSKDMSDFLIRKGLDVNSENSKGKAVLEYSNNSDIASYLISNGADVDRLDVDGRTYLINSVLKKDVENSKFWIKNGANIYIEDNNGNTALSLAEKFNMDEIVNLLYGHEIKPGSSMGKYRVGYRGPAGGWVIYDKGYYEDGWRYIEAAPTDIKDPKPWGGLGDVDGADREEIGHGKQNTLDIINSDLSPGKAADACISYSVTNHGKLYNDWYLPSKDELNEIFIKLYKNNVGNLKHNDYYSSTECSSYTPWVQEFYHEGNFKNYVKKNNQEVLIRPIRYF